MEDLEDHLRTTAKISPEKSSKYSLTYDWHDIKVDILPAVDVLSREQLAIFKLIVDCLIQ